MTRDVLHAVDIAADPQTVFKAVSTGEGLAGFWTSDSRAEPRVGSEARFGFKGAPVSLRMRVDELQPGVRAAWTTLGDFPHWEGSKVAWELSSNAEGPGTHLLFRHTGLSGAQPEHDYASVNYTWGLVVGALKAYAETGKPQPALG
jgi:uncharacterized protein YndB with AHSA1/START domain